VSSGDRSERVAPQPGPGTPGKVKKNVAPPLDLRLCPDAAAVARDQPLHGGEADAGPLELTRQVHTLEGAEQVPGVPHVEAGAVVGTLFPGQ
jgi:hypothetical protein